MRLRPTNDPQLVLLRHGQTEWSATGRHTGRTDVALLPLGKEQALAAGEALGDYHFGAVFASPLQRARMTAEFAGFPDPIITDDVMEWDYGPIEGHTTAEINAILGREFQIFEDGVQLYPDNVNQSVGETLEDVARRAKSFIATVEPYLADGEDVLVVAHGHFLRILGCVWLGLEPKWAARFELDPAAICLLGYGHHQRTIEGWNLPPSS